MNLLEMGDFFAQTMEVEIVCDVVLVYFCKELVAFKVTKPLNPPVAAFAVVFVVHLFVLQVSMFLF